MIIPVNPPLDNGGFYQGLRAGLGKGLSAGLGVLKEGF